MLHVLTHSRGEVSQTCAPAAMPEPGPLMADQPFTENVIPQMLQWRADGIASALVTLVGVDGSSPRRIGSQMAVNMRGDYVGYISSGCAEAAIVAEAVDAIKQAIPRTVRYGAGSKYMDVVLPCGSGIPTPTRQWSTFPSSSPKG